MRGAKVYAVGNPMGVLYSSITDGIVSSTQRNYHEHVEIGDEKPIPTMQISASIVGGNSGGAVYDAKGHQAGIVVRGYTRGALGFAVPLAQIKEFLTKNKFDLGCQD